MSDTRRFKHLSVVFNITCLLFPLAVHAQSTAGQEGRAAFEHACTVCHGASTSTSKKWTTSQWTDIVNEMVVRGAPANPKEQAQIVAYLSENFGPSGGAPSPSPAQRPVMQQVAPAEPSASISDGDKAKAEQIIQSNNCRSCHLIGETGGFIAPNLSHIGSRRSQADLRTALTSPSETVAVENRGVRIVTADGKTVTGKMLNQDGLSVQFIDAAGNLKSMSQKGLKELTLLDQNPMRSLAGKLNQSDVDLLVQYLSTMKEVNIPLKEVSAK